MGLSEAQARCKKHPKHRQSPGVCSSCLRERLSQLSSATSRRTTAASSCSSSLSSSPYSSDSSSCSSPLSQPNASQVKGPVCFLKSGNDGLMRSRSIAFVTRNRIAAEITDEKKKGGFWSKLLRSTSTSKRTKGAMMHSRTVRERANNVVY
ncbi:PREDICTED: uncharacterized protein LOC104608638 [Nelumbo nucifera]|uniref:Uncharacterized protein n=2 Tax=Nelumbo nucifera TaxID=4432 RepID=A0A822XNP0_NELNU|nr:PREDICTED: uncharacterized protein LOC104608638 [Nelumbo nucifera]DAD22020.1 TPA_asm: hypothetical protein HUJ06_023483 [Nelumbo nucifera]